ncbi:MAG: NHL repeat-containing protein, partial [Acidobacteriota bacterium]|nr:NHL repeat-containing protein [Acidobacteriota bacterium]
MKQFQSNCVFALLISAALQSQAQVTTFNGFPSRIVGQPLLQQQTLTALGPNLVEGRELNTPQAVAVDTSSSPSILYVADSANNRVLAWRNAAAIGKGDKADKVIGQRDFLSTSPKGPGSDLSTGLNFPLAVAADKSGNLYVADSGNNRILRYPAPFTQTTELLAQDLIIGQSNIAGRSPNQGLAAPTEKTLSLSNGSSTARTGLAFDTQGNLWVSDPFNNRVLRFPVSSLVAGQNGPAADVVLGQFDFVTVSRPATTPRDGKILLVNPSGLAFDPQNRLFVADNLNRVLVFNSLSTGASAARILGVILPTQQVPTPPTLNDTTLGSNANGVLNPPEGIFFVGNNPFIVDRGNARILKYDPFDQWPAEATTFSPKAIAVIGQPNFLSNRSNQGLAQPSSQTFSGPVQAHNQVEATGVVAAVFAGNDLYVADAGNNRVLIFPQLSGGTFSSANRLVGQDDFQYNSVNLIEGREFFFVGAGGSAVIDTQADPPHLYVSDPPNNRILGFKDYRTVKPGDRADLVIGQPNFSTAIANYPTNDTNQITDQGLSFPEGLALDVKGDLWVADLGNARVLRFAKPFDQPQGGPVQRANLVIGQQNFFTKVTDASSQTMASPYGIVFTVTGHLLVSDRTLNRVLFFLKPSAGDFVNGQSASSVIGQPDFGFHSTGSLSSPSLIAIDSSDRLYVADTGNNRIVGYRNVPTAGIDPAASFSLTTANTGQSISNPTGVFASQATGEIWVANTGANTVLRFPNAEALVTKTA